MKIIVLMFAFILHTGCGNTVNINDNYNTFKIGISCTTSETEQLNDISESFNKNQNIERSPPSEENRIGILDSNCDAV